jgi:hypothetical protein
MGNPFEKLSDFELVQLYKEKKRINQSGYMGEKRKSLVREFGFDTKNAAHLIRLLRMCIEFLGDGELRVYRTDKDELLDIKKGKWSLEKVQKHADDLFVVAREAYVRSPLRPKPDLEKVNKLCIDIIKETRYDEEWYDSKKITV